MTSEQKKRRPGWVWTAAAHSDRAQRNYPDPGAGFLTCFFLLSSLRKIIMVAFRSLRE